MNWQRRGLIARALRFGGIGVEYTGAEAVSHVANVEPEREQSGSKPPALVFLEGKGNGKVAAKAPNGAAVEPGSKPQGYGNGNGRATGAQVRALFVLSRKANYQEADVGEMLARFDVSRFEDLSRESASHLISYLQTEVAA